MAAAQNDEQVSNELRVLKCLTGLNNSLIGLHAERMNDLGLNDGDLVTMRGLRRRRTIAMVVTTDNPSKEQIEMNDNIIYNLRVKPGDTVRVYPNPNIQNGLSVKMSAVDDGKTHTTQMLDAYLRSYFDHAFRPVHEADVHNVGGKEGVIRFIVTSTDPAPFCIVTPTTKIALETTLVKLPKLKLDRSVQFCDIGGYARELRAIREVIELPLNQPRVFEELGVKPPTGILLVGSPGVGKTMIARATAQETGCSFFPINGPELVSMFVGGTEQKIRALFESAALLAPSIIFFDEVDSIAPIRTKGHSESDKKMVSQLLTMMDGINPTDGVILMGATNIPDSIDDALRRPGRFDREIIIGLPDKTGRQEILQIISRRLKMAQDVNLAEIADMTPGFVGADLQGLCNEAGMATVRRRRAELEMYDDHDVPEEVLATLIISRQDFIESIKSITPSSLRSSQLDIPNVTWADIGGMDEIKGMLNETIVHPIQFPDVFQRLGLAPSAGVLLYGPPGCGKTLIAKAFASECHTNFICVRSSELLSMWFGESEKNISGIFTKARMASPCVLFFDEFDTLAKTRTGPQTSATSHSASDRLLNQLLVELDGIKDNKGVYVIAATNRPHVIDPAMLRPGRFSDLLYVPLPTENDREAILRACLRNSTLAKNVDLTFWAKDLIGFSGDDIRGFCTKAARLTATRVISDRQAGRKRRRDEETGEKASTSEAATGSSANTDETSMEIDVEDIELTQEVFTQARRTSFPTVSQQDIDFFLKFNKERNGGGAQGSSSAVRNMYN